MTDQSIFKTARNPNFKPARRSPPLVPVLPSSARYQKSVCAKRRCRTHLCCAQTMLYRCTKSIVIASGRLPRSKVPTRRTSSLINHCHLPSLEVDFIAGSSTSLDWPKDYETLFKPRTTAWPERTPLEVVDRDGKPRRLSHIRGGESRPLLEKTMYETLEDTVNQHGERRALSVPFQNVHWRYVELKEKVDSLALGLLRLGVKSGDRIGAWLPNLSEWITLQYATARIGAVLVCVNPAYRASELVHAVNLVGLTGLFFQGTIKSSNYVELLTAAAPSLSKIKKSSGTFGSGAPSRSSSSASSGLSQSNQKSNTHGHQTSAKKRSEDPFLLPHELEEMPTLRFLSNVSLESSNIPETFPSSLYDDLLVPLTEESVKEFEKLPKVLNTDPTNLQFTSGTTGLPKGTTLTHRNIVNNGFFVGERLGMTHEDVLVAPVPMYHCFGCVMSNIASVTHGSHLVYPAPNFSAEATLRAVNDYAATMLHGVPTMFISERALPNFDEFNLTSLRTGIMAGSSCPQATMNMVREQMHIPEITIAYGMTETSPVSAQTSRQDPVWARVETVGQVQDHLQLKVVGNEEEGWPTLDVGLCGEILTKGYSVMSGYWGNKEATENSIVDGWMHTGDLGTIDENGYVRVIGRNKDMISRGGEKVYPREVEEFLYQHPDIQDVQIVSVPDDRLGEEIFAWVKLKAGKKPISLQDLKKYCKDKIAHYKVPRHVQCLEHGEEFPMTVSGKIQKFILRDRATEIISKKSSQL